MGPTSARGLVAPGLASVIPLQLYEFHTSENSHELVFVEVALVVSHHAGVVQIQTVSEMQPRYAVRNLGGLCQA